MEVKEQDRKFLSALKRVYQSVSNTPETLSPLEARALCTTLVRDAFATTNVQIKGSENLPCQKNVIFIYNHLNNHPYYTEDEGFQITLDSHFISSVILDKYYKDSGVRVVRHSLPEEDNHRSYYQRLQYIRVYAKKFLPAGLDPKEIQLVNKGFYPQAIKHLAEGSGLVFSPEGNSYKTGDSPGIFRYGIFKLACCMDPQPLIVPLVMSNFDKLASEDTFKCEIKPPFRMSDLGITNKNDPALPGVVAKINQEYKEWVNVLLKAEKGFESEILALEERTKNKDTLEDLVVFYGSSTIRLWNSLEKDFPHINSLNLGFGGAFISSLSENFERLFTFKAPKVIVLYLGGNDLSLGWTAKKIVEKISTLIEKIHQKYPSTTLVNLSIKPSLERAEQMDKIIQINTAMQASSKINPFLKQVDFFDALMDGETVNRHFLLQDGLHLNADGYKILINHLKPYL
jgi:lysophospholipase L1-like esterase/1-acyl-sn-glycerol-3-phosphate acyltransferase